MNIIFEMIGAAIVSLFFISIPILCALSFAYDWIGMFKIILIVACICEWFGLINMLIEIADRRD